MKKILITGAAGYLGSHLAEKLINNKYEVILIDKNSNRKNILGVKILKLDLLYLKNQNNLFKNISHIFHFAGIADIKEANNNPQLTIDNNIKVTALLIKKAIDYKISRFFFASTLYVYSKKGGIYKITKKTCEDLIIDSAEKYNLNYTILKFGSIYGGRANNFNLIKNLISFGLNGKKVDEKLTGNEIRSYIHIDDVSNICIQLMRSLYINKHILISGYEKITIKTLINNINKILKTKINIKFAKKNNDDHYTSNVFDIKPNNLIRVKDYSYIPLDDGLKLTIENYKKS